MKVRSLMIAAVLCIGLSACTHTREAYKVADTPDEYAYVLAEHYASLVKEAADLKEKPSTPAEAVSLMQRAELTARPVIKSLRSLRTAYLAAKTSASEAELQEEINKAVLLIAEMVRTVRGAAGQPVSDLKEQAIMRRALELERVPA